MKASVTLQIIFLTPVLITGALGCHVGERLRDTADQKWFEAGEIQGFIIPDDSTEMCFFNLITMPLQCQPTSRFLENCENCSQHTVETSVYRRINDTARMVNFRMLPPSTTLDKAYVIRVHNDTVVYIVKGHCSANDSLYENWSPIILLQRPSPQSCDASCANCTTPTTDTCRAEYISSIILALIVFVLEVTLVITLKKCNTGHWNPQQPETPHNDRTHGDRARYNEGNTGRESDAEFSQTKPTHSDGTQGETHRPKRISTDSGMGKSPPGSAVTSTTSLILKRDK